VNSQALMSRFPIDHLGLVGSDIGALVAAFRGLGFQVTEPAQLMTSAGDSHGVQHSAHVMVGNGYLELTAVSGATAEHHLAPYLGMPPGIRIVILSCIDAQAEQTQLSDKGIGVTAVQTARRRLHYGGGEEVGFRWFAADPQPVNTLLVGWVQHENSDELYHPDVCQHRNTAACLLALHGNPKVLPATIETSDGLPWYASSSTHRPVQPAAKSEPPVSADAGSLAELTSPISAIEWGVMDLARCIASLPDSAVIADDEARIPASRVLGVELIFRELGG